MTILVTGGDGQLGTCLKDIINESKNNSNKWVFLSKKELDITDIDNVEEVFDKYEPDYIINCAAYTNVDNAPNNISKVYQINMLGPLNLTICAKYYNAKVIHISTDFVFDGLKNTPYNTTDNTNPLSVYGVSKLEGEKAILKHKNSTVIRTSWLYSEHGNNFFKTMYNRITNNEFTTVVNDQIGTPTYAKDLAEVIYYIITYNNFENKVYHYSNEGCCSWYDFAKAIELLLKPDLKTNEGVIQPISTELYEKINNKKMEKRPVFSVLSKDEIKKYKIGNIPHWLESLRKCFNIYTKKNEV